MRVAVAMSGGVDSLKAAALLKDEGHEVVGIHMRLLPIHVSGSSSLEDQKRDKDLRSAAARLGISLIVVDFSDCFDRTVVDPFVRDYLQGRTPNPCTRCNTSIKFGALLDFARSLGAEKLATGHYARLFHSEKPPFFYLRRGKDVHKDQSYFLYGLSSEQLTWALFPLGNQTKVQVRQWAESAGFGAFVRRESHDICFISGNRYRDFISERLGEVTRSREGLIMDLSGRVLGKHRGIDRYTIGQRRGLGIPSTEPYYVVGIDASANTIKVGRAKDLYSSFMKVTDVNWISITPPHRPLKAMVQIRYRHRAAEAVIEPESHGVVRVWFSEPQRAVTPGQVAVFYQGDVVLGGGTILSVRRRASK